MMKFLVGLIIGYAIGHYLGPKINPLLRAGYEAIVAKIKKRDEGEGN
jgi:hypothetical protein